MALLDMGKVDSKQEELGGEEGVDVLRQDGCIKMVHR